MNPVDKIFQCRQCGGCCQGETTVSLSPEDLARMVRHLGMAEAEVRARFLVQNGNQVQMKTVDGHCIFYNRGCTIHPAKPWRCAQWPLHPSMLDHEENFTAIRGSCPGLAPNLDYPTFKRIFAEIVAGQENGGAK